jgi:hypothetical protein
MRNLVPFSEGLRNQDGSMLLGPAILLGALLISSTLYQISGYRYRSTLNQLNLSTRANNAAVAGFNDALNWFRRQPSQPVGSVTNLNLTLPDQAFAPDASTGETLDASLGLVREFPISDSIWMRYEVKRLPTAGSPEGARDITNLRIDSLEAGQGIVWSIGSVGYVYKRKDASIPFNQAPNVVYSKAKAVGEVRRINIRLPLEAAATVAACDQVTLRNNGDLLGGANSGLACYQGTNNPDIDATSHITPSWQTFPAGTPLTPEALFDTDLSTLHQMADASMRGTDTSPYPAIPMAVTYIEGNTTFTYDRPLRGSGLLVVRGNLTATQNTYFTGLIYATGNITITGAGIVSGLLILNRWH